MRASAINTGELARVAGSYTTPAESSQRKNSSFVTSVTKIIIGCARGRIMSTRGCKCRVRSIKHQQREAAVKPGDGLLFTG